MQRYMLVRFFQAIVTLWILSLAIFLSVHLTGDPAAYLLGSEAGRAEYEQLKKNLGLDKPLYIQYVIFLTKALQGDFGSSWKWHGHSAMGLVADRLPATLQLAGFALLISVLIALPVGVLSAVKKGTGWDSIAKIIALLGQSLPGFWLGIVLMWIFAVHLGWLPTSGRGGTIQFGADRPII